MRIIAYSEAADFSLVKDDQIATIESADIHLSKHLIVKAMILANVQTAAYRSYQDAILVIASEIFMRFQARLRRVAFHFAEPFAGREIHSAGDNEIRRGRHLINIRTRKKLKMLQVDDRYTSEKKI